MTLVVQIAFGGQGPPLPPRGGGADVGSSIPFRRVLPATVAAAASAKFAGQLMPSAREK